MYRFCFRPAGLKHLLLLFFVLVLTRASLAQPLQSLHHEGILIEIGSCGKTPKKSFLLKIISPQNTPFKYFSLRSPPRLVFDLYQVKTSSWASFEVAEHPYIKGLRIGAHPEKTRFVFDLTTSIIPKYDVKAVGSSIVISSCDIDLAEKENHEKTQPLSDIKKQEKEETSSEAIPILKDKAQTSDSDADVRLLLQTARVVFKKGMRPVQNVIVRNKGKKSLSLYAYTEAISPNSEGEIKRELTNKFFISPKRLYLEPGASRTLRILLARLDRSKEHLFAVRFAPDALRAITSGETTLPEDVFPYLEINVEPDNPKIELNWKRKETELLFSNKGNVRVLLEQILSCEENAKNCLKLSPLEIFPGGKTAISFQSDRQFEALQRAAGMIEKIVIPASKDRKTKPREQM